MTTDVSKYRFNHTMYRIRDPKASLKFYRDILGMSLLQEHHDEKNKFSNYFLGYSGGDDSKEDFNVTLARQGVLELTHNHGTESDPNFKGYDTGNGDIGGYGHIAIIVDDLKAACDRFDTFGVKYRKRPEEGRMRHIAFILDPDDYSVEILESNLALNS